MCAAAMAWPDDHAAHGDGGVHVVCTCGLSNGVELVMPELGWCSVTADSDNRI